MTITVRVSVCCREYFTFEVEAESTNIVDPAIQAAYHSGDWGKAEDVSSDIIDIEYVPGSTKQPLIVSDENIQQLRMFIARSKEHVRHSEEWFDVYMFNGAKYKLEVVITDGHQDWYVYDATSADIYDCFYLEPA